MQWVAQNAIGFPSVREGVVVSDYTGQVVFMGAGPYWLPTPQSATAIGGSAGVEMTLFCLIPHEGDEVHPVRVRMTHEVGAIWQAN